MDREKLRRLMSDLDSQRRCTAIPLRLESEEVQESDSPFESIARETREACAEAYTVGQGVAYDSGRRCRSEPDSTWKRGNTTDKLASLITLLIHVRAGA